MVCTLWTGLTLLNGCGTTRYTARPPAPAAPAPSGLATSTPLARQVTLTATSAPSPTPTNTPAVPLAARVNGQSITLADFQRQVEQYQRGLLDEGLDPDTQEGQRELAQIRRDVLESMIDGVLVDQARSDLKISLTDRELERQIEADIAAGGGPTAFEEWLRSTGQTRTDYKDAVRQALLSERVVDALTARLPTEAEQVHARHIQLDSIDAAEQVLGELRQGADFATLAKEKSLDAATRSSGGDLGWLPRGLLAPELEKATFGLQPGEISQVIQLGEGYHILQVVEREGARPLSPEVEAQLGFAAFSDWLAQRRTEAKIERFVGE